MSAVALCVNPMSGRDVRRLAARASNMTHEAKRDMVARIAAGAVASGVTDLYITREPFRIASLALEHLGLEANVHCLDLPLKNDASDTERAIEAFLDAGCRTIVSLGGDGTNRAIVRALGKAGNDDVHLLPVSTGTNNVFPQLVEPTIVGMVAGYVATARLTAEKLRRRAKVLHVRGKVTEDVGLIDAVLLRNDYVGNLLPFDAARIERLLLTRAEPTAIGMSPIGGLLEVVDAEEDAGLLVEMGGEQTLQVAVSPGLFQEVAVQSTQKVPFSMPVIFRGPGVLALDGDRDHKIAAGEALTVEIRRDGPWVVDVERAMRWVVAQGIIARPSTS